MKHTELSRLLLPYCDIYPLDNVTYTENGGKPAACNRVLLFEVPLQQDGQDRATAPCGVPNESRRKEYCRLKGHSYYRSLRVVATDVSILNLDSHRSLLVTSEGQILFRKLCHIRLWLPQLRNPEATVTSIPSKVKAHFSNSQASSHKW